MKKYTNLDSKIIDMFLYEKYLARIARALSIDPSVVKRVLSENNLLKISSYRKYEMNQDFFDIIDSEEKAYMLGFLFADGAVSKYNVALTLANKDEHILDSFSKLIFKDGSKQVNSFISKQKPYNKYSKINFNSKYMVNQLINLGCTPKKSLTLKFPKEIDTEIIQRHFIRGYFDGDGLLNKKYRMFNITSTLEFCENVKIILEKYTGAVLSISKYNNVYRLQVHGRNKALSILNWIYKDATIYLKRKYNIYQDILLEKTKYFTVKQIEYFIIDRKNGMTYSDIAKKYNCTNCGVSRAISRYKINKLN